jgi:hypothetical protein
VFDQRLRPEASVAGFGRHHPDSQPTRANRDSPQAMQYIGNEPVSSMCEAVQRHELMLNVVGFVRHGKTD